jgi:antitoxin ParD1/3/4
MRTMTVDTGESLRNFVEELVLSGLYKSNSEVVREGLRLLQEKQAVSKITALNKLLEEGEDSKDIKNWDADKFLKHLRKKHAPKKK